MENSFRRAILRMVYHWTDTVFEEEIYQERTSPQEAEQQLVGCGLALGVEGALLLVSL